MNTTTTRQPAALQPLLAPATRLATALAVMAAVSLAWSGAGHSSHEAVDLTTAQLSREVTRIQLPSVVVVGKRDVHLAGAQAAAAL